jgi:hypothetical protein
MGQRVEGDSMNKKLFSLIIGPALLALGGWSYAQQQGNGVPVTVVVTVEARHGSDVPVINREDVMVHEGHDRDQVTDRIPAQGDHAALEFFILIDDSADSSIGNQLEDIRKFISGQPSSTKIGVAYMRNGTADIVQDLTNDHALAAKSVRLPVGIGGGNASPYFSISDLMKRWPASNARREVLMASDGVDRYYGSGDLLDPYLAAAIEDVQRAGVIVSAIYTPGAGHIGHSHYRSYMGQIYLAKLAEESGGESYYIGFNGPPVAFTPYLNEVANRLNHQYLLTFLAKPEKKAGLRPVKVTTEVPNAELVTAQDVYVPAEPK